MLKVGLTGGMGSGKSTVATRLAQLGATVIDADAIAREIVEPGQPALAELAERFGEEILTDSGALDRAELARRAFVDAESTEALNAITHPRIAERTAEYYRQAAAAAAPVVVYDMPLLFEKGLEADQDLVLVVPAPEELRMQRMGESRGVDREDAARRIAAQLDDATRIAKADVVLDNTASVAKLQAQVDRAWRDEIEPRLASD